MREDVFFFFPLPFGDRNASEGSGYDLILFFFSLSLVTSTLDARRDDAFLSFFFLSPYFAEGFPIRRKEGSSSLLFFPRSAF